MNRDFNRIQNYLHDISKFTLLDNKREIELARQIKKGCQDAKKELITSNLRFVVSIAKSYQVSGLDLEDLINEGNIGLIRAVERFDETRGFKFITYAVWWIRQSIMQFINEKSKIIRLPLNQQNNHNKVQRFISEQIQKDGTVPAAELIAEHCNIKIKDVNDFTVNSLRNTDSLDSIVSENTRNPMRFYNQTEFSSPDENLYHESMDFDIQKVLHSLSERESDVIRLYYGIGVEKAYKLEEIGQRFHLTRERIRQIKERALIKLKKNSKLSDLKVYLN